MTGKCRRRIILQYFEKESDSADHSGACCDVCDIYRTTDLQEGDHCNTGSSTGYSRKRRDKGTGQNSKRY